MTTQTMSFVERPFADSFAAPTPERGPRRAPAGDLNAGLDLLERAAGSLLQACRAQTTTDRYIHAQLGAQRAAAALVVSRMARPGRRGRDGKVTGVWDFLRAVAPEFGEWSDYLALSGRRRTGLEAGDPPPASREADDLLRGAETFLGLIRAALGLPVLIGESPLAVTRPGAPGVPVDVGGMDGMGGGLGAELPGRGGHGPSWGR